MTKKQLIEKFKNDMPNFTGTESEIQLKKALYIYVELGKCKSFDERYCFGNSKTRNKIYRLAQKESKNIEEVINKRKIICITLNSLYCEILKEFDITAISSIPDSVGHVNTIIMTKDKNKYEADLQVDLVNIQTKSKLKNFRRKKCFYKKSKDDKEKFNEDKLNEILIEIGYIKNIFDYKDEKVKKLESKVNNKPAYEVVEIIAKDEDIYKDNEEMDIVELRKFYRRVLEKVVPKYLDKKVFLFSCYKQNDENKRDYTCCMFGNENAENLKVYLFSKKKRRFLEIEPGKIEKLMEEGLVLGARPGELGTKLLKKYIKTKKMINNNKQEKEEISL